MSVISELKCMDCGVVLNLSVGRLTLRCHRCLAEKNKLDCHAHYIKSNPAPVDPVYQAWANLLYINKELYGPRGYVSESDAIPYAKVSSYWLRSGGRRDGGNSGGWN